MELVETDYGYKEIYNTGTIRHYNNKDQKHNPSGPAVETLFGRKEYFLNGLYHRTDGPAVVWPNGEKAFFKHGKPHNATGPAIVFYDTELHFINGRYVWNM